MGEPRDDAMMEGRSMLRASRMLGWLVGWLSRGVACVAVARCAQPCLAGRGALCTLFLLLLPLSAGALE